MFIITISFTNATYFHLSELRDSKWMPWWNDHSFTRRYSKCKVKCTQTTSNTLKTLMAPKSSTNLKSWFRTKAWFRRIFFQSAKGLICVSQCCWASSSSLWRLTVLTRSCCCPRHCHSNDSETDKITTDLSGKRYGWHELIQRQKLPDRYKSTREYTAVGKS